MSSNNEILAIYQSDIILTVFRGETSSSNTNPNVPNSGDATLTQVGHNLTVGTPVYLTATGFVRSRSDDENTLARYLVKAVTVNTVTIARDGDVVGGFSNLIPTEWYHCSPTIAGTIEPAIGTVMILPGSYLANPVGQAFSSTELIYRSIIPYSI